MYLHQGYMVCIDAVLFSSSVPVTVFSLKMFMKLHLLVFYTYFFLFFHCLNFRIKKMTDYSNFPWSYPELFTNNILFNTDFPTILACRQVSMGWKQWFHENQFWKQYLKQLYRKKMLQNRSGLKIIIGYNQKKMIQNHFFYFEIQKSRAQFMILSYLFHVAQVTLFLNFFCVQNSR